MTFAELSALPSGNSLLFREKAQFEFETVENILAEVRILLAGTHLERMIQKRAFNVVVECLDNMSKHAAENCDGVDHEECLSRIKLEETPDGLTITSGNVVPRRQVESLKEQLEQLQGLDRLGLKAMYKNAVMNGTISEKGGAGLGLLDIAKRSGNNLRYNFREINQELSYFILEVRIYNRKT